MIFLMKNYQICLVKVLSKIFTYENAESLNKNNRHDYWIKKIKFNVGNQILQIIFYTY